MKRFWQGIIKSIIESVNPETMIEIGVDKGENTKNILEYCSKSNCKLISIDPFPDASVSELEYEYKNNFKLLRDLSLNILSELETAQVIFIDGDHNWYTVYHELVTIEKKSDKFFPLIFLHDIEWPYAKRDLYYNPDDIPANYRQEYAKKGIDLHEVNLINKGGFNVSFNNAIRSGTEQNGVLTAVIDFLNKSKYDLKFIKIKGFHGLGIIYDHNLYLQNPKFKKSIDNLNYSINYLEDYIDNLSDIFYENINEIASLRGIKNLNNHLLREKSNLEKNNANLKKDLEYYKKSIIQKEKNLKFERRRFKKVNSQMNDLQSAVYEMSYLNNTGRPFSQKLISHFPSIYLLLKRNNNEFKTTLINIKGYNAIKKNRLLDIGYYLKNNRDVRRSGIDPIIHYMFHGYKEGRNPSPTFNTKYYLKYKDVKKSKLNPLVHYSLYGKKEGRRTNKNQKIARLSVKKRKKLEDKYGVSIIMPTYNRDKIIERAINSVLNQTFKNFELIIVDDGSTDGTDKLIQKKYGQYLENEQIKYFKQQNKGVSNARNKGLEEAQGNIIAYLDSDNYWFDNYLEKMVFALAKHNKNTAYASIDVNDDYKNRKFIRKTKYSRPQLLKGNFIDLNVFVHKRFLYNQLGGFDESLKRLVDWDLILRYTKLNEPYFVNEVLADYYLSEDLENISHTVNLEENKSKIQKLHSEERIEKGIENLSIAYVLWDFPAFSQTFVMNELRWLVENNYDVKVFYKIKPDKEAELDFDIEAVQVENMEDLIEKLNEYNINMMHTHFVYPAGTLLTYPAAEKTKIPFTISAHAIDIFLKKNDGRNKIKEISQSKYCKRVFIPGQYHYEYLSEREVPEEKLMFLRQATKYEIDQDINIETPRFKRKIKNVITIARFVEKKGIDTLIDAAKILEKEDLIFKIYGYGPLENDLKRQIKELNLKNVVMAGTINGADALKKAYHDGDLFVLPCRVASNGDMDGMPTVLLEAMAYGIPIITTNVSVIPDFIKENYSGFLTNPNDPSSLAQKILHVKSMKQDKLFSILKHAQTSVKKISSVEETIETMLEIWENKRIDIFMVTYQKDKYKDLVTIKELLDRLFKHTTTEFNLTIVDNDSDKDFKNFITDYAEQHHNIRLIFLKENLLCGPASNIALESIENEFAIYICSNEGFILKHGWERKALDYMRNNADVGMAGNLVSSPSFHNGETYKNQEWFDKFRNQEYIIGKEDFKFQHVQGGGFILRKTAYDQNGGFNPLLPQNHMDVEYSYYLESNGWTLSEIPGWISLTIKTKPGPFAYLDEYSTFVHPLKYNDLSMIENLALKHCNICKGKINKNICSSCGSNDTERTVYRIISKTDKIYRSLPCTLLLKHNSNHQTFGKMFELVNKKYSTQNIYENIDEILKNLEQTEVIISDIPLNEQNYQKTISNMITKLTDQGLLVLKLPNTDALNNKIKEFLTEQKFTIKTMEFASKKLDNNEFLVAEWLHE